MPFRVEEQTLKTDILLEKYKENVQADGLDHSEAECEIGIIKKFFSL